MKTFINLGYDCIKKYHDKIFKIFHTLNRSKDSTGIGLSIVKKIVGLHGGDIWLESEPTVGTTFYFTIPKNNNTTLPEKTISTST